MCTFFKIFRRFSRRVLMHIDSLKKSNRTNELIEIIFTMKNTIIIIIFIAFFAVNCIHAVAKKQNINSTIETNTKNNFSENLNHVAQDLIPPLIVTIDYRAEPEAQKWAELAAVTAKEQYPFLVAMLDSEGYKPPRSLRIIFIDIPLGAFVNREIIYIPTEWVKNGKLYDIEMYGMGLVIHEMVHIIQAYEEDKYRWIKEGIADYFQFFWYARNGDKTCIVNPEKAIYTDGYRTTAAFFDWIVRTKDAGFIKRLNAACRNGTYSIDLFKNYYSMTVDELWDEFIQTLKKN